MDAFATAVSFNLQYGVPLKFLVDKFAHVRFEPSGWTGNQQIPYAKSIMDYIFRWLGAKFLGSEYAVTEAGETPDAAADGSQPAAGAAVCAGHRRRSIVRRMRLDHDPQRKLLQVRQLRRHQRLQLRPGIVRLRPPWKGGGRYHGIVAEDSQSASTPENLDVELEKSRASAAHLLDTLAQKLRARPVIRQATTGIGRAANYVHGGSVKSLAARLNRTVRKRPVTCILIAAAAGFLTARSLRHR